MRLEQGGRLTIGGQDERVDRHRRSDDFEVHRVRYGGIEPDPICPACLGRADDGPGQSRRHAKHQRTGKRHFIVIVAEGIGHSQEIANEIQARTGIDTRATILGHVQRGGSPSAFDRILASRLGARAVQALMDGETAVAAGLVHSSVVTYPLTDAYACQHTLRPEMWELARVLSI